MGQKTILILKLDNQKQPMCNESHKELAGEG